MLPSSSAAAASRRRRDLADANSSLLRCPYERASQQLRPAGSVWYSMGRKWVIGWKLDERDRTRLLASFPPRFPDVVGDHITLRAGADERTPLPSEKQGEVVGETDDGQGVQALVVSIGGTADRPDGRTYHIT